VLYESESGDMVMALTGESLITRALMPFKEPRFLQLRDIIQAADVSFTNAETLFHDFEGCPAEESPGTFLRCDPRYLEDLKWMGIKMAACAINHAYDYTDVGVLVNKRNLDAAGIANAGTGRNLTLARAPAYLDTPKGRVALLSATDHVNVPSARAIEDRPDAKGRPGTNHLRVTWTYDVDAETFAALRSLDEKLGFKRDRDASRRGRFPADRDLDSDSVFHFGPGIGGHPHWHQSGPLRVQLSDKIGRTSVIDEADWQQNLKWLADARRMADWVLFSFHCGFKGASPDYPVDHLVKVAHEAIDAGADVFIGHGPHRDQGIEIYKGKPIFYSIGDFILHNDTPLHQPTPGYDRYGLGWENTPADFYYTRSRNETVGQDIHKENWQSFVADVSWESKKLKEIRLHPIDLGKGLPMGQRGRPVLAEGEVAREILERIQRCSKPFSTNIVSTPQGEGIVKLD
jgi:poly-gamma-glutamate capsule biosynthesis protein CapA/YwtB (metallophosphatase superfamily)